MSIWKKGKENNNNFAKLLKIVQGAKALGDTEISVAEPEVEETPVDAEVHKEEKPKEEKPVEDVSKEHTLSAATAKEVYDEIKAKLGAEGLLDKEKIGSKLVGDIKRGLTFLGKAFTTAVREGTPAEESLETPAENILVEDLDQDLAK